MCKQNRLSRRNLGGLKGVDAIQLDLGILKYVFHERFAELHALNVEDVTITYWGQIK